MNNIKSKAVNGVKWTTLSTIVVTLVQILRLSVLTRILDKSDFGIIAIATMVIGFTDIFSELGLTVAVIHKQNITDKQYSSVYWTNIILSTIVFFLLWVISPFIASFYNQPILTTIIPILGIQVLLNGFGKIFQTIKSKKLEYGFISKVRIITCLVGFVVTVVLALLDFGVYSLVIGQLSQVALMQGTYAIEGRQGLKILWHLNFREISDFIKIGTFRLGSQILDFISSKIDVFLIGKFFGMDDLGIYNLAKDLILKPYGTINQLTSSVASSAFAQIQNDIEYVRSSFKKIVNIVCTISIPIYAIMFISADLITEILYGSNFIEVAFLIRILAFVGIECSVSSQGSILQVALGRTDIGFKWTVVRIVCSIGIIIAVSQISIEAVAFGQLILSIISIFLFWLMAINPIIKISYSRYCSSFIRPLLLSFVITIPIFLLVKFVGGASIWQVAGIFLFSSLYVCYYYVFQRKFLRNVICVVRNKA